MNKPKVSVVVPVYNVEPYLDRCMVSLLKQTLHDIEIILVDDESPDCCPQMCDEYAEKDERVKVIHKQNGGLGLARNSGLEVAQGEYVAFIDSDDFVELDMFERLYAEASCKQLDALYTEFNTEDYPEIESPEYGDKMFEGRADVDWLRLDIVGAEPKFKSCSKFQSSACKGIYSMSLIEKHNVRFLSEREYISEDLLFNLDFLQYACRVETKPWRLYHYCQNGASLSHTYRKDRWAKLQKMIETIENRADTFCDKTELELRLTRTLLAYSKLAVGQELARKDIGKKEQLATVREIVSTPVLQSRMAEYPIRKLSLKWRVYGYLVKWQCCRLVCLTLK